MYVNNIYLRLVELTIRKLKKKQVRICIDKVPFKEGGGGCLLVCMHYRSCTLLLTTTYSGKMQQIRAVVL
jgi:hypothetical protein